MYCIYRLATKQPAKATKKQKANLIEQGENSSSDDENEVAQALAISRRVRNASPVYSQGGQHARHGMHTLLNLDIALQNGLH